jgi:SEC-C motif domain protein
VKSSAPCPCHSNLVYGVCCRPLHEGDCNAPDVARLMRSRYAAFALGLGAYLVRTLAQSHPDRVDPALELSLSRAKSVLRYMGLSLVHVTRDQVLFHARVFAKGRDQSFAELSTFTEEADVGGMAWRYASGILLPTERLPKEPLTLSAFTALTSTSRSEQLP